MSKKITFHTDGTELYLSSISATGYQDEALTTQVSTPYAISDGTVVYVSDEAGAGKVFITVSTSLGTVVHVEDVTPASHPASGAHIVVQVDTAERRHLDRSLYADRKKARIREILAGVPTPQSVYTLSTENPTITSSSGFGTTSISSGVVHFPATTSATGSAANQVINTAGDSAFRWKGVGATKPVYGNVYPDYLYATFGYLTGGLSQARRWDTSVAFNYDGQVFEILFKATSATHPYRLTVNGRRLTERSATVTDLTPGTGYRLQIDMGTAAPRSYQFDMQSCNFGGIGIEPTYSISRGTRPKLKVAVFGDSHTAGAGGVGPFDTWGNRVADLLGADEFMNLAVGGSAFTFLNPGSVASDFRNRVADVVAAAPDVLIMYCGFNDASNVTTTARQDQLQAEYEYVLRALKVALPEMVIVTLGAHPTGTPSATILRTERAIKRAAANQGVFFVGMSDPLEVMDTAPAWPASTQIPWGAVLVPPDGVVRKCITTHTSTGSFDATKFVPVSRVWGTGKAGSTNGTGNADYVTSSDGIHMTQAGHSMLERQIAAAIISKLRQYVEN